MSLEMEEAAALADGAYGSRDVDGWERDEHLSNRDRTVYSREGKAVVAFRGTNLSGTTDRWRDLGADALIALGLQDLSHRFRDAKKTTKYAMDKYGDDNVTLVGHSLGGSQALHVHTKLGIDTHAFNPGISLVDVRRSGSKFGPEHVLSLFPKRSRFHDNAHAWITSGDLVGGLAPMVRGLQVSIVPKKKYVGAHSLENFL
jgi:hypothetical protein